MVASIIISIASMLFSGFLMSRLTKKLHLPNVTAYILTGIIIGPYCLNVIPGEIISGMSFLSDIALAFISFSTGEFFKLSILKKNGLKVVIITLLESLIASVFVFILTYCIFRLSLSFSIVLSALASATAPASTMMTIRQTSAEGNYVNTLLQVVALDDVVGLIAFSVAVSVAGLGENTGAFSISTMIEPMLINIAVIGLGALFGFVLTFILSNRSKDNRLIITLASLFAFCGICALLNISPLLGCMSMGTVYINMTDDSKLFKAMSYFSPPFLLLFFVRSGLNFKLESLFVSDVSIGLVPLFLVGIFYTVVRILGKYVGAYSGCTVTGMSKNVRNYLGLALIPQAGVAIGLASLGARVLGDELGRALETIVLASSVLYELVGPGCAKLGLYLSGSYLTGFKEISPVNENDAETKTDLQLLIEQVHNIQKTVPEHRSYLDEAEEAFLEEAELQQMEINAKRKQNNRFFGGRLFR